MAEVSDITQINAAVAELETKLTAALGPNIWIYAVVLQPSLTQTLVLEKLNPSTIDLISQFINLVNKLLKLFKQPEIQTIQHNGKSVTENLTSGLKEAMLFLYNLRLTAARQEYAQYCLRRMRTALEKKILTAGGFDKDEASKILYLINLPGLIQMAKDGSIDIETTANNEANTHAIKTYFSVIPSTHAKSQAFYNIFFQQTSKGMVPRVYESEIRKLGEQLMALMLAAPVHDIYSYLKRGYVISQAIDNVQNYYFNIIKTQNNSLLPNFATIDEQMTNICKKSLEKIKSLNQNTKDIITDEMKSLVLTFFSTGAMLPSNYYQVAFRKPNNNVADEVYYDYLLDSFLVDPTGNLTTIPIETYGLELIEDAKTAIFETVTNGQINPQFTLTDYLGYQKPN